MRSFEPGRERAVLGFAPAAEVAFGFLTGLGFHIADRQVTLLRYESSTTYVVVYHARGGYDLGTEIGLLGIPELDADLAELMVVQGAAAYSLPPAETPAAVARELLELAELVRQFAMPAISGERSIFEAVRNHRRVLTARYMEPVARERLLAEAAWDREDYQAAAEHYARIDDHLTPDERRRIDSAPPG